MKTIVIAEAGVNHNGSIRLAEELIEVAAASGADFVKFQTFKTESIVSHQAQKAQYQIDNSTKKLETQHDMLKRLELDIDAHHHLQNFAHKQNIKFLSTPFDLASVDLLNSINIEIFKIPSGEITNKPLLRKIAQLEKPVILSTGMSTLGDIEMALNVLLSNGLNREQLTVLHCTTEYPTPYNHVNLKAMLTIANAFDIKVGYSDHTLGIEVPIAAVAIGATIIEKHFTLDRNMDGPDHAASLEPSELKLLVSSIRNVESALGSPVKTPTAVEVQNRVAARKSLFYARDVAVGEQLDGEDLICLRPGVGVSPMQFDHFVGKVIRTNVLSGTLVQPEHFNH